MFVLADIKWGTPTLGESGGIVQWNQDLSTGLVYDENLYELTDFEEALRSAFDAWEDVADINFVESLTDAEITVEMAPLADDTIGLAELTFFRLSGTDQFIEGDLSLDSEEEWAPFGETDLNFYAVAVHEIGHALGLLHVDDESQIMHEFLYAADLGDGDVAGAQAIYGEAPVPVFEADDDAMPSFFERFFNLILSIFGLGSDTTVIDAATRPVPWDTADLPDIADLIPVTELIDENGDPVETETIVYMVPDPDAEDHGAGCACTACCLQSEIALT